MKRETNRVVPFTMMGNAYEAMVNPAGEVLEIKLAGRRAGDGVKRDAYSRGGWFKDRVDAALAVAIGGTA